MTTDAEAYKVCHLIHLFDRQRRILVMRVEISREERSRTHFASTFIAIQCVPAIHVIFKVVLFFRRVSLSAPCRAEGEIVEHGDTVGSGLSQLLFRSSLPDAPSFPGIWGFSWDLGLRCFVGAKAELRETDDTPFLFQIEHLGLMSLVSDW